MNFNTAIVSFLSVTSSIEAAYLRSPPVYNLAITDDCSITGCANGQICAINKSDGVLKRCDGSNTYTLQSGQCVDLADTTRIWSGPDDSKCCSNGLTLLETSYSVHPKGLAWDISTLTGYNYAVKVENGGSTLLDLTSAPDPNSCAEPNTGLFPCQQTTSTCQESSGPGSKWQPICVGCGPQCCDHIDNDCNPTSYVENTANTIVTFSGSRSDQQKLLQDEAIYLTSDAYEAVEVESIVVTVSADFDRSSECIYESNPLTVFVTESDQRNMPAHTQETFTVTKDPNTGMHFGIQGNDWYWRTNTNPHSGQWADNVGAEVVITDPSTCSFTLNRSWGDDQAPYAGLVLDMKLISAQGGCHFSVTRKSTPQLMITKGCAGPCIKSSDPGCECTAGGNTSNCPTESH